MNTLREFEKIVGRRVFLHGGYAFLKVGRIVAPLNASRAWHDAKNNVVTFKIKTDTETYYKKEQIS